MTMDEKDVEKARYEDCPNQGATLATWKAEHLCFRCLLGQVCHAALATGQVGDALIVVARCRSYTPPE